jgi:alkanesulfonate monooxygenase SsuD/methylene tetrahydromethanopterin reductase-like flavin-dependent oxidoreductase (luciferase family)
LALRHSISTPGRLWSSLKYHKYSRLGARSPGADGKHLTTKSLDDTFGISSKQAATLDALSAGRLSLGVGIGGREDDFQAAPATFHRRGRALEEQITAMRKVWSGGRLQDGIGPIGPKPVQPKGPELLIGAYSPVAIRRVGRWADGFMAGLGSVQQASQGFAVAQDSWQAAGRLGRPRFVAALYYALGNPEQARAQFVSYYAYKPALISGANDLLLTSAEAVKQAMQSYESIGVDEFVFWPALGTLDQVHRLADLVG